MSHPDAPAVLSRAWRADARTPRPAVFVVDCGPSAHAAAGLDAHLPDAGWRDQHAYVLIDAKGNAGERFDVTSWSIDDELGVSLFAVVDGALRKLSLRIVYGDPVRVERDEKTIVDGLEPVAGDDRGTLDFLAAALARRGHALTLERERRDAAAEARLDTVSGARDDYGAGADFRRAQDVLCGRVRLGGDDLYETLLRALVRFGALDRSIRAGTTVPASFDLALDAFVAACRVAAFDRTFVQRGGDPTARANAGTMAALPAATRSALHELEAELAAIERDLVQNAQHQEWSDARANAIAMRSAAAHVARARGMLAAGRTP